MAKFKVDSLIFFTGLILAVMWLLLKLSGIGVGLSWLDPLLVVGAVAIAWGYSKFREIKPLKIFILATITLLVNIIFWTEEDFLSLFGLAASVIVICIAVRFLVHLREFWVRKPLNLLLPGIILVSGSMFPILSFPLNLLFLVILLALAEFNYIEFTPRRGRLFLALIYLLIVYFILCGQVRDYFDSNYTLNAYLPRAFDFIADLTGFALLITLLRILINPFLSAVKKRLQIRTKLGLSYLLTGAFPILTLLLIFILSFFLMSGGFRGAVVKSLLFARINQLEELVSAAPESSFSDLESLSAELSGLSGGEVLIGRLSLMELAPDSSEGMESEDQIAAALFPLGEAPTIISDTIYFHKPIEIPGTILVWDGERLGGLALNRREGKVIGAFRPINQDDLEWIKSLVGLDLSFWRIGGEPDSEDKFKVITVEDTVSFLGFARDIISTESEAQPGILNKSFPIGLTYLTVFRPGTLKTGKTGCTILLKTSFNQLYKTIFSTEERVNVNRGLLYVLGGLSFILLLLILLAVSLGFAITGLITSSTATLKKGTLALGKGDLDYRITIDTRDELGALAVSFNMMASEVKRMMEEVREKERLKRELQIARSIQINLLPKSPPEIEGWDIATSSDPAQEVGGDFFDFINLPEGRLAFSVGDVSGKGMPAALLMSNLQASLRIIATSGNPPGEIVASLNHQAYCSTSEEMFATMFFGLLDTNSGVLKYVNAGHDYPLLLKNGERIPLSIGGIVLGAFEEAVFEEGEVVIDSGDSIFLYSDGITEAMGPEAEFFGLERLYDFLKIIKFDGAKRSINGLFSKIDEFTSDIPASDDRTAVWLSRR